MDKQDTQTPLAERLRPESIDTIFGQEHLVGPQGIVRKFLDTKFLPSLILWGPPGCGKTTLALAIARQHGALFEHLSAVTSTVRDVRAVIATALEQKKCGKKTILFIDEIHRFNKAQQDALLPHVENGTVIFIGATTENPSFEVIAPLLSRTRVLVLKPLGEEQLKAVMHIGLSKLGNTISEDAQVQLLHLSNGDARSMLTILDIASHISQTTELTKEIIEQASQKKSLRYDRAGDEHYDTISAFIKSMRASDPDAALYYLARMIDAGEDPLFIARRMVVFASEDIGMAKPTALVVANAVFAACQTIGYPECRINLAHGVVYLSKAKKDRSSYDAYESASSDVATHGNIPIPLSIRNAPTKLMKNLGYGSGYKPYSEESHLPDKLKGKRYLPDDE